jgi:multimeric flavodoxin WrbA
MMTDGTLRVVGIAASLRNARWGHGNRLLVEQLVARNDKAAIVEFLADQSELHVENFLQAGRREGKAFAETYRNLRRCSGQVGLSNSEVALAAALWAASRQGVQISHLSLAEYFDANGNLNRAQELCDQLRDADGVLISGPVYFGDRGSLGESLIDFIARNREVHESLQGRVYGGIAVGAKRNGGQETTLMYQLADMLGLGLLGVGNDSDTTAQYGGTGHAGDVGTMHRDSYGIDTSMGVGRRVANVVRALASGRDLAVVPRALFLILQDVDRLARNTVDLLVRQFGSKMQPVVLDLSQSRIMRCLACDICPTSIDLDEIYRCVITSENDALAGVHNDLLHHDIIIPVIATAEDRGRVVGNYQAFIERSRYLRRGDYVWSDVLVAPITLTETPGYDTYSMRLMTSFLRHNTVMSPPLVGQLVGQSVLGLERISVGLSGALQMASRLAAGRLALSADVDRRYRPIGYVLSADKDAEDERMRRRNAVIADREAIMARDAMTRLRK